MAFDFFNKTCLVKIAQKRNGANVVKTRYDRGVGRVPNSCPSDKVKDGALCYPACRGGFGGAGPACWPQR